VICGILVVISYDLINLNWVVAHGHGIEVTVYNAEKIILFVLLS